MMDASDGVHFFDPFGGAKGKDGHFSRRYV
ncbi:hypothetical protein HNR34_000565 [Geobacillus subterraneus]